MGLVKTVGVPFIVVDTIHQAFTTAQGIAHPTRKFALVFLYQQLHTVGAALAFQNLAFYKFVQDEIRPVDIVDLVVHLLVVEFDRGLEHILLEIAEVANRVLVRHLRLHIIGTRQPNIYRR